MLLSMLCCSATEKERARDQGSGLCRIYFSGCVGFLFGGRNKSPTQPPGRPAARKENPTPPPGGLAAKENPTQPPGRPGSPAGGHFLRDLSRAGAASREKETLHSLLAGQPREKETLHSLLAGRPREKETLHSLLAAGRARREAV